MKLLSTILLSIFSLSLSFSQSGSIAGKVQDAKNKEAVIGAIVQITGTTLGAATDAQGNFVINKVPAGLYTLKVSFISYKANEIPNVRVEADKQTAINTEITEESQTLNTVTVKARKNTSTEIAVISEIRQVQQIAVGVSAQQIARTQDRDASSVVRRIPGVSIMDDRFVVVRGLNERYNTVLLNDIITPSTEVDVKSFSFDLIPSTAIDRMLVFKSASADLPGDMGGGAIKIYTKTVPDGAGLSVGLATGFRSGTTFQNVINHAGSNLDWLGFDNGLRALPAQFPNRSSVINYAASSDVIQRFKNLPSYYNTQITSVMPDFRGNINYQNRWFVKDIEITNISYLSYSFANLSLPTEQSRYDFNARKIDTFVDQQFQQNTRLGAMSNWSVILNPRNKIEFRNLFNQLSNKETVLRNGANFENNLDIQNAAFRFEQRSIYSGQLSGTHELSAKSKLKWIGGLGYTFRQEPDFRRFTSTRQTGSNQTFQVNLQQFESPTLQQAARFYSKMDEVAGTGSVTLEQILGKKDEDKTDEQLTKLKVGIYSEYKDRYFSARWFGIVNPNRISGEILSQSPTQFFGSENLSPTRLYYAEGTNYDDKYTAQNLLAASYANLYVPFSDKFNVSAGVRGEYNRQQLQSRERGSGTKISVDNPVFSLLPSINLTYKANDKHVVRAAYSTTVNRPEFRELAPFTYYDFNFDVARRGNRDIKVATIYNLDLRYDFYPSKNELISIGVFNKQFRNPIEAAVFYNGSTVAFTVANAQSAYSRGVELEVRKSINKEFQFMFNLSLIDSDVRVSGNNDFSRYLQGQSPYLVNTGIFYSNDKKNLQANILYNVIGPRIFVIGDNVLSANVYEMPRHVIDLNLTKNIGKRVELKLGVQDVLNQAFRLVQDTDRNNKITDTDGVYQTYRRGTNSSVGITYRF
jgi:TonB dependent receptor/CarboxypepD_reg-like domain/TonB-dependent Receptor Plug Domain